MTRHTQTTADPHDRRCMWLFIFGCVAVAWCLVLSLFIAGDAAWHRAADQQVESEGER